MSLQEQIATMQQEMLPQVPPEVLEQLMTATADLVRSGIAGQALRAGDKIPRFALPNATGRPVDVNNLLKSGPLVISFYRGGWCPYCNLELRDLQRHLPQFEEFGTRLVAISPEQPDHALSTREKLELEFEVLSDAGNQVARQFGLVFTLPEALRPIYREFDFNIPEYNGDESYTLPIPATYVVGKDGVILHAFIDADYTRRQEPSEIVRVLIDHAREMAG